MMTSTIRKFGVGVASLALVASAAAPAFAANNQEVPGPINGMVHLDRFGGYDRIETAIQIAEKAFEDNHNQEVAYIAGAADASAVDSAAAGHLSDGPLYLVGGDPRSQKAVAESINRTFTNVQKIIAIGGTAAVSDSALKTVAELTDVAKTGRIAGKDRYETAAAIAEYGSNNIGLSEGNQFYANRELLKDGGARLTGSKVYLARGDNPVDALVSGVLDDAPVLLLGPDGSVPEATAAYLKKHLPTNFVALGGDKAVPTSSFMKADFDPVMKNVWTNDQAVKAAIADVQHNQFLLDGVPGGDSVNPKHTEGFRFSATDKYMTYGLSTADEAIKREELKTKQAELKTKQDELDKANKAKEDAGDTVKAAKKAAVTVLVGDSSKDPLYKAYEDARKNYYGTSAWGTSRGLTNYNGSYAMHELAQKKLDDFNTVIEAGKTIDDAVSVFFAEVGRVGENNLQDEAKAKLAKDLHDAVSKYIGHYADTTGKPVSGLLDSTAANAFANAKKLGEDWRDSAKGGLKGFAADGTSASTNIDGSTAGKMFAPTDEFKNGAARDGFKVDQLNASDATKLQDAKRDVTVTFLGMKGAADLLTTGTTLDQKITAARDTLTADLVTQKAYMDLDKAGGTDEKKDAAIEHFLENSSETTAKKYREVAGKYDDAIKTAQEAVDDVNRQIAAINEVLEKGSWNNGFMGYKRIQEKYSVLEGEHSNAMRSLEGAISLRISQLKNEGKPTTVDVANDASMKSLLKLTYGVDLTEGNVETYFAFKTVDGVNKVSQANFRRLRAAGQSSNIVAKAKELIDEFYRLTGEGFDTGTMRAYFAIEGTEWHNDNVEGYKSIWKRATPADRELYTEAAKAVWDALNSDSTRGVDRVTVETDKTILTVWDTWNKARRNTAAQVSKYLLDVAQENRKTVEANLAKAKIALQQALDKVLPKRYDRIEGSDRYNTSAAIAAYWRATYMGLDNARETTSVYVANGISYIDAVAGGQLKKGPIVLVAPDGKLTDAVKQRFAFGLTDAKVLNIVALGGSKVVSDQTLQDAKAAARDKSLLGKNFFTDATNKANDNAKDKKADEKKADDKKADEKKADDKK